MLGLGLGITRINRIAGGSTPPPAAPVSGDSTNKTDVSFYANWSASAGATKYYLDVSTDPLFGSFVAGFNNLDVGNVTTYPVTGLSANITYYSRERAYNTGGTSADSNVTTTTTYTTEAQDYFDLISPIDDTKKDIFNSSLVTMTSRSYWARRIQFLCLRNIDAASTMVNMFNPGTYGGTLVNSPIFSQWVEVAGDGASAYINSNLAPNSADGSSQNDVCIGFHISDLHGETGLIVQGESSSSSMTIALNLDVGSGNESFAFINYDGGDGAHVVDMPAANNLYMGNRSAVNRSDLYKNGASIANNTTDTSAAPESYNCFFLARNLNGVLNLPVPIGLSAIIKMRSLTAPQQAEFNTDVQALMTALL